MYTYTCKHSIHALIGWTKQDTVCDIDYAHGICDKDRFFTANHEHTKARDGAPQYKLLEISLKFYLLLNNAFLKSYFYAL